MKKVFAALLALAAGASPALADYVIKDGNGALKTIKSGTVSGSILPYSTPTDATGTPYSVANPLAVVFGAGVTLPSFATPQQVICISGCAGGGGGGSSYTVSYASGIGPLGTPGGYKDVSGNFQPFLGDTTNGQWVTLKGSLPAFASTPTFNIGTAPTIAVTGAFFQATQPVSAVSLPLPAGASTSALQTTGNSSLSSIDGKTPSLGQALSAASVPVVLPATQITALTPPSSVGITGTLPAFAATPTFNIGTAPTITVTGSVTASAGTNLNTSLLAIESGGNLASINTKTPALGQALAAGSVPVVLPAAQLATLTPLSTVTVTQATGSNLHVVCDTGCSGGGGSGAVFGPTAVGTAAANPPVAIGGTVDGTATGAMSMWKVLAGVGFINCANCSGSGVSAADQAAFTAGSSLFAPYGGVFNDGLTTLSSGQQAMQRMTGFRAGHSNLRNNSGVEIGTSASPLFIGPGSGQTFASTQSGTWNITNITGTISLPTGAATSAKQPALGTAGTASTDVLSVQGIASMTPLLTNPGTAANWGVLAQNATTAGQLGGLVMGAVTTAAPSYTTGQTSPLSIDLNGNLRVVVSGGGGGGGAVTLASGAVAAGAYSAGSGVDGWDLTQGTKADAAYTGTGSASVVAALKGIYASVNGSIPAGTAIIGKTGIDQTTPGTTNGVVVTAAATGGASTTSGVAAATNNATVIKASAGTVYSIQTSNINASTPYFIKLYNKATAPTCGTDTPVARFVIPPTNGGNNVVLPVGKAFTTGIGMCIVTGIADNDNTAVPAATVLFNVDWS